jgi:hypothetical protein
MVDCKPVSTPVDTHAKVFIESLSSLVEQ